MTVELSDFEMKVVRNALLEYTLMIKPGVPPHKDSDEPRPFISVPGAIMLVVDTANDVRERLERVLVDAKGPQPARNTLRGSADN